MAIPLNSVINVQITIADRAVSQQGFGTPMIVGSSQAVAPARVKTYSSSDWSTAMLADGYLATSAEYRAASAMMAASPRVALFKVARRSSDNVPTQEFEATPQGVAEGKVYVVRINDSSFSYVAEAGDVAADVSTELSSLINAGSEPVTSSVTGDRLELVEDDAGAQNNIRFDGDWLVADVTPNAAVATELAAILAADPDFYGFVLTSNAPSEISAAAAWAEANKRQFRAVAQDSDIRGSEDTDLGSTLQAAGYHYTKLLHSTDPGRYHSAAWLSKEFSYLPGTYTMTYQSAEVPRSSFSSSELTNLFAKNVGVVDSFGGLNIFYNGKAASGRYTDTTRFVDWLHARVSESVANLLVNARGKVPFTDSGIAQVKNAVMGPLLTGVNRGALVGEGEQKPTIFAPRAASVPQADKANRNLPDVNFSCVYTGAIESVQINGTVSL